MSMSNRVSTNKLVSAIQSTPARRYQMPAVFVKQKPKPSSVLQTERVVVSK